MRRALLLLAAVFSIHALPIAGQQPSIKRLDGSTLTSAEIDATVTRVQALALPSSITTRSSISRLTAFGTRKRTCRSLLTP